MTTLFDAYDLAGLPLPNRAVMSPMTRSRAIGGVPNDLMATYYAQRAGAGLIVTEGVAPSPNGLGYPRIPGLWSREQVDGWRKVTDAVHEAGGRIFAQIMHTGRVGHPANLPSGGELLAPSAVPLETTKIWVDAEGAAVPVPTAREMSTEEVHAAIEEFVLAARNAIEAGFDGIELHGANGYLLQQFLHPHTNRRDDEFGGSPEARRHFVLEVARRVADAIGPERVGIRVSPFGVANDLPLRDDAVDDYVALAGELSKLGLAYLHLVDHSALGAPAVPEAVYEGLRSAFGGTLILAGGYDLERANRDLDRDRGDLVAFGRPFIANPDLVERLRTGAPLEDPRPQFFYSADAEGYTDYPVLETSDVAGD